VQQITAAGNICSIWIWTNNFEEETCKHRVRVVLYTRNQLLC